MNTLTKSTNNTPPCAEVPVAPVLSVQRACLLLLGSVMLLPAYAQRETYRPPDISIVGQGTGPMPMRDTQSIVQGPPIIGLPPQGGGFISPPPPPSVQVSVAPATPKPPIKPFVPGPQAGPPPGAKPDPAPSLGVGPAAVATLVNTGSPPPANTNGFLPVLPVDDPVRPSGGSGPTSFPSTASLPPSTQGVNVNGVKPPSRQEAVRVYGSSGGLGEILPGAQKLGESMQVQTLVVKDTDTAVAAASAQTKCTGVSLRPDAKRQAVSLVDLLGDGLIVAAVSDTHIQSVFSRAGYGSVDLSKAARWCITPTAARELLRPAPDIGGQDAALLVQTGGGLQLMSQDQWLAHQASLKPLVAAMTTVNVAKTSKSSKVVGRALNKRTAKSAAGITVGALRLPAGASKAAGTAS